jgi:vitamin B12 transporter
LAIARGCAVQENDLKMRFAAAQVLLLVSSAVLAQSVSTELDPVVVSATRTAETQDRTLAAVTVISRADIERLQPQSLQDLFTSLPGVAVSNVGGPGKATYVYLRGTSAAELLVLLDGIKIGDATSGLAPFEQIPLDQIERIEIVRGPRASLYGSDAVGGVIQIFTRRGSKGLQPTFSVGGGTYDTWDAEAGLSGGDGHAWYSASATGYRSNGINATRPGYYDYEPDADGYWNASGSLRGGYRFDDGAGVSADWLRIYGHTRYDGGFRSNESTGVKQILGANLRTPKFAFWQALLSAGQSEDRQRNFGSGTGNGNGGSDDFNTLRNTASWQNDIELAARQRLTAGIDYLKDHVSSNTAYTGTSRENAAVFAQYRCGFGAQDVQLSARDDRNQQFGTRWTGAAAWGYSASRKLRITASYGTAFRAPSFNDLYFPQDNYGNRGNPDLRPESSVSGALGLSGRPGAWDWSVNAYQTNVHGMIVWVADPTTFAYSPTNVARTRLRGLEGQVGMRWRQWRAQLYANGLDARDRTEGNDNHLLPRQPAQTLRLDVDRNLGRYSVGATVNAVGRRFDDGANTQSLGGYALVDLRGSVQLLECWLLQARLSNVFDKHYETAQFYNQPGRALYITLRYRPGRISAWTSAYTSAYTSAQTSGPTSGRASGRT